jgi:tetratricopeptide (TPR) repeat protein
MNGYGDIFFQRGDYQRAAEIYKEALSLARELGYKFLIACNLYNLGVIAWYRGEYTRAVQLISESQPIFRHIGHHWLSATSLHLAGDITLAKGDEAGAGQWYEEELSFNREAQLEAVHIFALEGLGKVAWVQGDFELATKHFEEALSRSRVENIKPAMFNALYLLGRMAQARGDSSAARPLYTEALKMQRRRVVPLFRWASLKTYQSAISYPLAACAVLAVAQNDLPRAIRLFGAAETLYAPLRFEMSAKERAEHDQAITSARVVSGEEKFTTLYEDGRKMTLPEAVAYALSENGPAKNQP